MADKYYEIARKLREEHQNACSNEQLMIKYGLRSVDEAQQKLNAIFDERCAAAIRTAVAESEQELTKLRPIEEWHEDEGHVLLWRVPIMEPPYCGSPLEVDFPADYYTHWSKLPKAQEP